MEERFIRNEALIGKNNTQLLKGCTVAVFGIGGVGSYAVEALARSGIGRLYLYDNDTVAPSNLNRQLIALENTIGLYKTAVSAKRCRQINPDIEVVENTVFVTPETEIPFDSFDFIIDAVDNVTAKLYLITSAQEHKIPIISVMGTGNKLDPTKIKVSDIYETRECPLARVMRTELKKRGIKKLSVVWSDERPIKAFDNTEKRNTGRPTPSSMTFVPATAGITAAAFAVKKLIK
ncbi:MAG: tRNA threonylcarbamoyladenosine dehydratase [Ruminococcaceae bacterium]|nr:tRNA threonylcarbamoyladenosine dehydratase [Oscillospiraceae bacterium]